MIMIQVPDNVAKHFLEIAEMCGQKLDCAGCNDFPVEYTPEDAALYNELWAALDPEHEEELFEPGEMIYFQDNMLFAHFVEMVEAAMPEEA